MVVSPAQPQATVVVLAGTTFLQRILVFVQTGVSVATQMVAFSVNLGIKLVALPEITTMVLVVSAVIQIA